MLVATLKAVLRSSLGCANRIFRISKAGAVVQVPDWLADMRSTSAVIIADCYDEKRPERAPR